jgi:hypothetical protein
MSQELVNFVDRLAGAPFAGAVTVGGLGIREWRDKFDADYSVL